MLSGPFNHTLHKRQYFQDAKLQEAPQLSEALSGVGFGSNAILTVSAPILSDNGFSGISQGAILLSSLTSYTEKLGYIDEKPQYIITDKNNSIIYASPSLALPPLSQFDFSLTNDTLIRAIPTLNHKNNDYLFEQTVNEFGWTTTVLVSPSLVTDIISSNFYVLALSLVITLFVFSIITNLLSKRITLPLVHLAEHFDDQSYTDEIRKEAEISDELVKVTGQLINSREIMLNFQEQLTRQVQNKTKQLKSLNQQLYNLAQKDGLTNLLNRSGFDDLAHTSFRNCVRNNIPLTLVLLDIDDFKLINDTHGHPFGDKCIVSIAKTLNQFCKRNTDILGRYGGEEFILFLSGGNIEEHHDLVKRIHRTIQKTPIASENIVVNMTVSIGVTSLNANYSMSFEGAVKSADEQLYKSKRTGKNKISIYVQ
jgi:diguanylate cyclase (GGDEF)-like protein